MTSSKLDPTEISTGKSPHKVTPEIIAENNAKIIRERTKTRASRLKRGTL